eukprot:scaffold2495_cov101-Isochrysis_galbana.AAC.13
MSSQLRPAAGFSCDFAYISKMSVPSHKKMLQPPIGASPGELRLWRKQNGLLNDAELRADALEHQKARSRHTRPFHPPRLSSAGGSETKRENSAGAPTHRASRLSMVRPVLSNVGSVSNTSRHHMGLRRHSCMPSMQSQRVNTKHDARIAT